MRCVAGRPGSSCWGEPVFRKMSRAVAGVSKALPEARNAPCKLAIAPTIIGDALEVPLKVSVYQRSSLLPPCKLP